MSEPLDKLLIGAKAIAAYDPMIADPDKAYMVYDLFRRHRPPYRYPIYKRGGVMFARKPEIDAFYSGAGNDNERDAGDDAA